MNRPPLQRQHGITLIICMIILLVLTVMGLGSIRDTSLEEKMAGNLKNHNTAFQAAESGLRAGEQFLEDTTPLPDFDGTGGLYLQMDDVLGAMSASWAISSARNELTDATLNAHLASEPLYVIEHMTDGVPISMETGSLFEYPFFRVTARSAGSTDTAVVILQSIYKH